MRNRSLLFYLIILISQLINISALFGIGFGEGEIGTSTDIYYSTYGSPVLGGYYSSASILKNTKYNLKYKHLVPIDYGVAVLGYSEGYWGVVGCNIEGIGVKGYSFAKYGQGVFGCSRYGDAIGVKGNSGISDGVVGKSSGYDRSGVYGDGMENDSIGVMGKNETLGGIAIYSDGDTIVNGCIVADNLSNLVQDATLTSSSEIGVNYSRNNIRDGIFNRGDSGIWKPDLTKETTYPYLKIKLDKPQNINEIYIYKTGNTSKVKLTICRQADNISKNTTDINVDMPPYTDAPKKITLSQEEGTNVVEVILTVINGDGLAEIECYNDPNVWKNSIVYGEIAIGKL